MENKKKYDSSKNLETLVDIYDRSNELYSDLKEHIDKFYTTLSNSVRPGRTTESLIHSIINSFREKAFEFVEEMNKQEDEAYKKSKEEHRTYLKVDGPKCIDELGELMNGIKSYSKILNELEKKLAEDGIELHLPEHDKYVESEQDEYVESEHVDSSSTINEELDNKLRKLNEKNKRLYERQKDLLEHIIENPGLIASQISKNLHVPKMTVYDNMKILSSFNFAREEENSNKTLSYYLGDGPRSAVSMGEIRDLIRKGKESDKLAEKIGIPLKNAKQLINFVNRRWESGTHKKKEKREESETDSSTINEDASSKEEDKSDISPTLPETSEISPTYVTTHTEEALEEKFEPKDFGISFVGNNSETFIYQSVMATGSYTIDSNWIRFNVKEHNNEGIKESLKEYLEKKGYVVKSDNLGLTIEEGDHGN